MKKLILVVATLIAGISIWYNIIMNIEYMARIQNNLNIQAVETCISNNEHNTTTSFKKTLNVCAKDMRSLGITGDIFVVRKSDRRFFWDASRDAVQNNDGIAYLNSDDICKLFYDIDSCIKGSDIIFNDNVSGQLTWQFDDSKEWLSKHKHSHKIEGEEYIIVQGSQYDEAINKFTSTFLLLLITIISTCLIIIFNKNDK